MKQENKQLDRSNLSSRIANLAPAKRALLQQSLKEKGLNSLLKQSISYRGKRDSAALSFAQQRLWFLDQYEPNSSVYNVPSALRLRGKLDVGALAHSLNEIVRRHESLRTTFSMADGEPVQVISRSLEIALCVVDLGHRAQEEREEEARRLAREEAQQPFDLAQGPLFRGTLIRLADDDHLLVLTLHHIVSDGWSMGVLNRELSVLYGAFSQGEPASLADLPIQYGDFAVWQREWLQGEVLENQLSYWKKQLEGIPAVLNLPTDRPRPAVQSFRGSRLSIELSKELTEGLKALSRKEGVTLFMTLLAAFQTLLYRYTGQEDIVVGSPIANRNRTEIEGLIGFFVNTLVLRTNFDGNPTFKELLARVREMALGAYAQQDLPFEKLVEELQPERSLSHSPLFQVMFVLQNAPSTALTFEGLSASPVRIGAETAKFDLTLSMSETLEGLRGSLQYSTDLFDDATIAQLTGHLQTLLEGIVGNPDQRISHLPILTQAEEHQLLVEWNDTQRDYPKDKRIHQLFETQVEKSPDAVAVIFEDQQLTYRDLNARANQLAHHLKKRGVGPDVLVGICVERSLAMLVALLAIMKAGGAYVPLDPEYPEARLAWMLEDSEASTIVAGRRFADRFPEHQAIVWLDDECTNFTQESLENPVNNATPSTLAYVIYTSGSTGTSKGVMIEHRSVVNYLYWFNHAALADNFYTLPVITNFTFDASLKQLFAPLLRTRQVWILPDEVISEPSGLVKTLSTRSGTGLNCVPTLWNTLLDGMESKQTPLPSEALSVLLLGGEKLNRSLADRTLAIFPHVVIWNLYGPTEATANAIAGRITCAGPITLGTPIDNTEVVLLDANLQPVPVGVTGELYIGGVGLARGYLGRPDLTAEKFIPHPFSNEPGARLYKTGDLVRYLADGNIEFLGRIDQQVKIRGFRIELGEIESALAQHSAVQEVAVLAREDVPGEKRLVAYVVLATQQVLTSTELRIFVKAKLPDYMVPSAFVFLDSLPLTPNGKVDRKALPVPDQSKTDVQKSFVAPRTAVEETLARIWAEVLKLECVGIHDNFFELGGDSILSIQIVARTYREGLRLTPKQMFQHQTVAELAAVAGTNKFLSAEQGLVTGKLPLTAIQRRFFEANFPAPHHWNMAMLLEARQVLNPILLERAVQQLVLHHDALRMRFFREQQSGWQQEIVQPQESSVFSYIDLSGLEDAKQEGAIKLAAAELQAGLNLFDGPLMRVALFDLGSKQNSRLLLIVHHLVVDGVSLRILLEDLQTAYQQLSDERPVELPAKTTSLKQWAERITEYARSSSVKKEIDYWLTSSNGQVFHLPVDYAGGANTEVSAQTVSVSLTDKETQALLHEIPKTYHTQINDVLLTALVQAFSAWTGKTSLLIELEGHGREEIFENLDLSRTVGWFTICFPVCLEIQSSSGPEEALKLIKEQLRSVPNRGIGFGLLYYLSESTAIAEQLRGLPQPEISFNYLGQFDQVFPPSSPFDWGTESAGPTRNPFGNRRQLLAVTGRVKQDRLMVNWNYSENLYRRATIERLARSFVNALRDLISHSQSPRAEAYTPSDFPGAKLNQKALDGLIARLRETGARKSK